jgi:hypothetical protein
LFDQKDDNLMVFVTRDERTGRNMAYARIAGTIDENNIITPLS